MPGLWAPATLTILGGQTESPEFDLRISVNAPLAVNLLIIAPATLPETITIRVTIDGTTYGTLQSGAADIVLPAGKATQVQNVTAQKFKLVAGAAVGVDRLFHIALGVI